MPPMSVAITAPVRNGRWLTSGFVARFSRTYIALCAYSASAPVEHPAGQAFELPVRQRSRFAFQPAFRNRRAQKRTHLALEFILERKDELRQAVAEPRNAHGLDVFLPRVLIVGSQRENLFKKHLRRNLSGVGGEFRAAIPRKHAFAHDRSRQRSSRD